MSSWQKCGLIKISSFDIGSIVQAHNPHTTKWLTGLILSNHYDYKRPSILLFWYNSVCFMDSIISCWTNHRIFWSLILIDALFDVFPTKLMTKLEKFVISVASGVLIYFVLSVFIANPFFGFFLIILLTILLVKISTMFDSLWKLLQPSVLFFVLLDWDWSCWIYIFMTQD